ncbi:glyoxalase superfamily protein [Nocardia brasiliensis]|uniref:glyoxalase superfamily protein n=1 Tax=Nocardia brasiliensis TaxID=37326 RepID=UPI00379BE378
MNFTAKAAIPVLRIFDREKAREFYLNYLGFMIDWEHRYDGHGPTYTQISRGPLVLHLSEHHGDGTPGQVVYIPAVGVRELHAELQTKSYDFLNPGIGPSPGDNRGACLCLLDPFGNTLRIDERAAD